jgi:hypothetical protein
MEQRRKRAYGVLIFNFRSLLNIKSAGGYIFFFFAILIGTIVQETTESTGNFFSGPDGLYKGANTRVATIYAYCAMIASVPNRPIHIIKENRKISPSQSFSPNATPLAQRYLARRIRLVGDDCAHLDGIWKAHHQS